MFKNTLRFNEFLNERLEISQPMCEKIAKESQQNDQSGEKERLLKP